MEANEGRWDLSALYNGFDDPAFEADIARLDGMMEAYRQQVRSLDGLDAAALADLLGREEAMWVVGADLQKFTNMRREADAGDSQAVSAMGRLKKLFGSVAGEAALVRRWDGRARPHRGGLCRPPHPGGLPLLHRRGGGKGPAHAGYLRRGAPGPDAGLRGRRLDRPAGLPYLLRPRAP